MTRTPPDVNEAQRREIDALIARSEEARRRAEELELESAKTREAAAAARKESEDRRRRGA